IGVDEKTLSFSNSVEECVVKADVDSEWVDELYSLIDAGDLKLSNQSVPTEANTSIEFNYGDSTTSFLLYEQGSMATYLSNGEEVEEHISILLSEFEDVPCDAAEETDPNSDEVVE
ncbi:MAG: hypothetical protein HRT44_11935, partial [Bdellovibrionales bacterium]|nr:hypothetical protein [Bdellovibrionales bacterium]